MQIHHGLPLAPLQSETALTIGVFDGVHLGHQLLINQTLRRARETNRACAVLTFDPHPVEVLAPHVALRHLTSIAERAERIAQLGVDMFCVIPFTDATAQTSARDFVRPLVERLRMRGLFIGHDFALGHKRQGNAEFLRALGAEWGFTLDVVEPLLMDGEIISSTRIRQAMDSGKIEEAAKLLGRPIELMGVLTDQITIHADPKRQLPADGLYQCLLSEGRGREWLACEARVVQSVIDIHNNAQIRALVGRPIHLQFVNRAAPLPYEEVAHTADVAIRARGRTLAELLCHAAQGMFALMTDLKAVTPSHQIEIEVEAPDRETLLVNWLSELLYQSEMSNQVFCEFEVRFTPAQGLHGTARGGPSGEIRKPIKAVTFHDLSITERDGDLETTIVFDV